jgi:hypothetical protein
LQLHDDVAHDRVEAFIRGEDNETLVGTEKVKARKKAKAPDRTEAKAEAAAAEVR